MNVMTMRCQDGAVYVRMGTPHLSPPPQSYGRVYRGGKWGNQSESEREDALRVVSSEITHTSPFP
jgi:hypothetical protein